MRAAAMRESVPRRIRRSATPPPASGAASASRSARRSCRSGSIWLKRAPCLKAEAVPGARSGFSPFFFGFSFARGLNSNRVHDIFCRWRNVRKWMESGWNSSILRFRRSARLRSSIDIKIWTAPICVGASGVYLPGCPAVGKDDLCRQSGSL